MTIRAAFFDFDGTLADSFAAITSSTNFVRAHYGLPPLAEAEVRQYVGYGLTHLMSDLVPNAPVDDAVLHYREHHARVMVAETKQCAQRKLHRSVIWTSALRYGVSTVVRK